MYFYEIYPENSIDTDVVKKYKNLCEKYKSKNLEIVIKDNKFKVVNKEKEVLFISPFIDDIQKWYFENYFYQNDV